MAGLRSHHRRTQTYCTERQTGRKREKDKRMKVIFTGWPQIHHRQRQRMHTHAHRHKHRETDKRERTAIERERETRRGEYFSVA